LGFIWATDGRLTQQGVIETPPVLKFWCPDFSGLRTDEAVFVKIHHRDIDEELFEDLAMV
jgi:hypothetical protein